MAPSAHGLVDSSPLPKSERAEPEVHEMASYGCLTRMHVVRLLAPMIKGEDHTKDIDFSSAGIQRRREAGYEQAPSLAGAM